MRERGTEGGREIVPGINPQHLKNKEQNEKTDPGGSGGEGIP